MIHSLNPCRARAELTTTMWHRVTQVLMVLGKALGGRKGSKGGGELEFDYRPIRVADLFSRREQRAKELKKVTRGTHPGDYLEFPRATPRYD